MSSTAGSPPPQETNSQDDGKMAGFLSSLPSMHSTFAKSNTKVASPHSTSVSKLVGSMNKRILPDSRKSFFQKHSKSAELNDPVVGEGEGGSGINVGTRRSSSPRPQSPHNDSENSNIHHKPSSHSTSHNGMKHQSNKDLQPFWLKGLIVDKNRSTDSAEFWIENPIHCGYLHAYCLGECYYPLRLSTI